MDSQISSLKIHQLVGIWSPPVDGSTGSAAAIILFMWSSSLQETILNTLPETNSKSGPAKHEPIFTKGKPDLVFQPSIFVSGAWPAVIFSGRVYNLSLSVKGFNFFCWKPQQTRLTQLTRKNRRYGSGKLCIDLLTYQASGDASKKKSKLTTGSHLPFQALEMSFKSDNEFYFLSLSLSDCCRHWDFAECTGIHQLG